MNATLSFVPTPSALRDEHRIRDVAPEREQSAERSDARQHARRVGLARQRLDAPHDLVAGVDVDARLAVVDF